ncbi:3-phytase [gamma proteobacterium HTCC5015]|nr:3-phytase [gamma proteobacterium HTCC5015]
MVTAHTVAVPSSLNNEFQGNAQILPIREQWLLASESQGLQIIGAATHHVLSEGRFELLDRRFYKGHHLAVSYDIENNQPVFIRISDADKVSVSPLSSPNFQIDGLCLQNSHDGELYLWLLDGDGRAEQWWIQTDADQTIRSLPVRQLSVPPETSQCAVDDERESLLLVEEGLGIWAYPAHPEDDFKRQLLAATQPWGGSLEKPMDVDRLSNGFAVLDDAHSGARLVTFHWRNGVPVRAAEQALKDSDEVSTLSLGTVSQEFVNAWVYDEGLGQVQALKLRWSEPLKRVVPLPQVVADIETEPMPGFGDVADDPAIWVNPTRADQSLILGTNKKGGLASYDLQGRQRQFLPLGHLNNVDVRSVDWTYGGDSIDVAAATNRSDNSISVLAINRSSGKLEHISSIATPLPEIYGFCLYHSPVDGGLYAFANDKSGLYVQYRIDLESANEARPLRQFKLASQPEGCVADDKTQRLFVGEEAVGVWWVGAEPHSEAVPRQVKAVGGSLTADVEGLALYHAQEETLLVISSQGSDSYLVLEAQAPWRERGHFRIGINAQRGIDGSSETDGLAVTSQPLGPDFPTGVLVVQDGRNVMPQQPQNFKLVSWQQVESRLSASHEGGAP